jgi:hypothetical protein
MSAKYYYLRHNVELGEATRECDCHNPCVKVVKAEDYDSIVSKLEKAVLEINHRGDEISELTAERDAALLRLDAIRKHCEDCDETNSWFAGLASMLGMEGMSCHAADPRHATVVERRDPITAECPKCHAQQEDHDGLGVLHCVKCGYCTHAAVTGNVCCLCGGPA